MRRCCREEITIRSLDLQDVEAVLRVHYGAVHETAAADYPPDICTDWSPPITPERTERYVRNMTSGEENTVVAVVDGRVMGFASIVPSLSELRAVYVSPGMGRCGVGSALLRAVEELARRRGLKELQLDSSLTAERFYAAHGYQSECAAEHTLRTGRRMPCVRMRKPL
jgi:GNAT superfamily N-acetyltransferase